MQRRSVTPLRATPWATLLGLSGLALLVLACGTFRAPAERAMSFAEMQSLNAGVSGAWVLEEYPFARSVQRHANGQIAELGYVVEDPADDSRALTLRFDTRGVLTQKLYDGPWIRPPEEAIETEAETTPTPGS